MTDLNNDDPEAFTEHVERTNRQDDRADLLSELTARLTTRGP